MKNPLKILAAGLIVAFLATNIAQAVSILTVQQGGTGVGTITGLIKGNGTSPFSVATPGTDYLVNAITSLNGLNAAIQTFATGTSGSDFNISSATSTHTFNLPTASATNRGALSSTDWSTFNAKESALTFSTGLTRTSNTITNNLSTGVSGGQSVIGGTGSGENLTLSSTSNATKGKILFGTSAYNEANNRLGIGTTSPSAPIHTVSASGAVAAIFQTGASSGFNIRSYGTGSSQDTLIYPISSTAGAANDFILGNTTNNTWLNAASASNAILLGLATNIRATIELNRINFGTSTLISSGSAYITPTSLLEVRTNSLGVTQTTSSGLALTNTTAAAAGAQQISPALRFSGLGWGTTASTSQDVSFRQYTLPVQAGVPTGRLTTEFSVNGGAYNQVMSISSNGNFLVQNGSGIIQLQLNASDTSIGTAGTQAVTFYTSPSGSRLNVMYLNTDGTVGIGSGTNAPSSKLEVRTNALGTSQTTSSGLALTNTTAASAGAQQISPAIRWSGKGWKTDATAASRDVDFRSYVVPVQGAANPTGYLTFESSINGAAYSEVARVTNTGVLTTTAGIISGGTIRLKGYTVATLPAGTQGDTAYVTDALAPTFLGALVGGGAIVTPVFHNGTAWISH